MEEAAAATATVTAMATSSRICGGGCDRPVRVCLCHKIPSELIATTTQLVILQHPHEVRHKLATVPLLSKCLLHCHVIVGRKLRQGSSPLLDSLFYQSQQSNRAFFLFPGTKSVPSIDIHHWKSSHTITEGEGEGEGLVMIVFDATWKHAKEMMTASLPFLSKFATCVHFECDYEVSGGSIYDSDLILRKEPFRGCMSTMEAVARAFRIVDPHGLNIEAVLLGVLKSMVELQASYVKHMKPRSRLLKKGVKDDSTAQHQHQQQQQELDGRE